MHFPTNSTQQSATGSKSPDAWRVAEIQGLYGPFSFSEKLLQKIWLRQDFDIASAFTFDGRKIEIIEPGTWNLLAGPDFKNARLRLDGTYLEGDIEIHLYAEDWTSHGHHNDPAYNHVVLHVVLFVPDSSAIAAKTSSGKALPVLPLLPLMRHDLENYVADDAIESLTGRTEAEAIATLLAKDYETRMTILREMAQIRWRRKVHFAQLRVARCGWDEACHQTALEILGYRFNRIPMLKLATRLPLEKWRTLSETDVLLEFREGREGWNLQGVRPANQPLFRLKQYYLWTQNRSHWPDALKGAHRLWDWSALNELAAPRSHLKLNLLKLREMFGRAIVADAISGPKLDTLICDGFLPLLSTATGSPHYETAWFNWAPGDLPSRLGKSLAKLGASGKSRPALQGLAQGLLEWLATQPPRSEDSKR